MFRMLYSVFLPFLLPFLFFWAYRRMKSSRRKCPVPVLAATGLGLVFLFLFVFSVPDKAPADSAYVPPKFENGRVVPAILQPKKP